MLIKKHKITSILFALFTVAYILLSVLLPQDKAALHRYHISTSQAIELTILIIIPYVAIWFIALNGYLRLKTYAEAIKKSKDGAAFMVVRTGVFMLALWLPLSALAGTLTTGIYRAYPSTTPYMVNLNNYFNILLLAGAFAYLYVGSKKLLLTVRRPNLHLPLTYMVAYISLSTLYVFMVLRDPARQFPTQDVAVASYYLPDLLTVMLIIIPRLVTWFLGVQAVYNILLYRQKVKGIIYKQALNNLAGGLGGVILAIVVLRCFQSLSPQITELSLVVILLIIYILLALISVGYVFIAKGAKHLLRIEQD